MKFEKLLVCTCLLIFSVNVMAGGVFDDRDWDGDQECVTDQSVFLKDVCPKCLESLLKMCSNCSAEDESFLEINFFTEKGKWYGSIDALADSFYLEEIKRSSKRVEKLKAKGNSAEIKITNKRNKKNRVSMHLEIKKWPKGSLILEYNGYRFRGTVTCHED